MRIVGGIFKGRVLCPFEKIGVRPTSDMARESLFNILQNRIVGASFLDLFAGTGAMGIEALSRGAENVVINDFSRDAISLIKKNLEKLKIDRGVKVLSLDAVTLLTTINQTFDIVYIDPPYASDIYSKVMDKVSLVLNDNGIVIVECEKPISEGFSGLEKYDQRKYGRAFLTFYKKG